MRWSVGVLCGLAMVLARPVAAQQAADSMAFRSGQWGAEFTAGSEARSLGVLKFLSPRRALVLEGSGSFGSSTKNDSLESSSHDLHVRLGMRWFRTVVPRVRQYVTVGALVGVARSKEQYESTFNSPGAEQQYRTNHAGIYSNVGGMWQVTAHLALGANVEASYLRRTMKNKNPGSEVRVTSHGASIGTPRFVVSVLF